MADGSRRGGIVGALYALQRASARRRLLAIVVAAIVGLALASVHWSGLMLGGAFVGWTRPTLGQATLTGLGFGILALVAFALSLWLSGTLEVVLGMGAIPIVTVAMPLALGLLGGLSRGLVPDAPTDSHR